MNIKNEKSHKLDYREVYMLHRLDIQRLSGKKTGATSMVTRSFVHQFYSMFGIYSHNVRSLYIVNMEPCLYYVIHALCTCSTSAGENV